MKLTNLTNDAESKLNSCPRPFGGEGGAKRRVRGSMRRAIIQTSVALLNIVLLTATPVMAQSHLVEALTRSKDMLALHLKDRPAQDLFLGWMNQIAQKQLDQREAAVAAIHTIGEAQHRQKIAHEKLLEIMGGLTDHKGPLNARITGKIQTKSFTIEKVIYESQKGFYVTANLYRPNLPGRYPGILLQSGHVQPGKPEGQRLAINLALKGFVVLAFDPLGQGEREQSYDRQLSGQVAGWGTMEHLQGEAQSRLLNQGVARYFIWDAVRSLDYLAGRPEVEATRLGAVGCSGGGAMTTYIGALDPRIKAVASACSTNSFRLMFARPVTNGEFHAEMGLPRFLAAGLDTADMVEAAAPKPWMIMATEHDFFTPDAAKLVYEDARRWYGIYGAEDKLRFFVGPGPHGTPLETRENIYQWMIRWLKDGKGNYHEQPVDRLYTPFELQVTASGHVENEPGSRKLYQIMLDELRAKRRPGTIPQLLTELHALQVPSPGSAPEVKVLDETSGAAGVTQRIRFETEPGLAITGKLYIPSPSSARKQAVLLVADRWSSQLAETIAKSGRVVLELEPRDSPWGYDYRPYIGSWVTSARADHIGRNLSAMRAHDILRGVDVLAARSDVDPTAVRAYAGGIGGIWLLLAAATDSRIGKVWLDRTPHNFQAALENSVTTNLLEAVVPGFVLHWDLQDLVKAMGTRQVLWTDPTNWMDKVVSIGPTYRYRYELGDNTYLATSQNDAYLEELLK